MQKIDLSNIFSRNSAYALVLSNLIPLIGALFFGWNVAAIVVIYWTENLSVGFFNVLKMFMIGNYRKDAHAIFLIPFFLVHYGMFTVIQGIFVFLLFGIPKTAILAPAFMLFLSHGYSFFDNFIMKKAYEMRTVSMQMFMPYARVVVMQITVILGGALILNFGARVAALAVMVIIKIIIDLFSHTYEYSYAQE